MEPLHVLIADDEPSVCTGLCKLIDWGRFGCAVSACVQNGAQALAYLEKHKADIIITDIQMPVLDGLELIERLREQSDAQIMILSGYKEFSYARRALEFGVQHYLLKPVDEEELGQALTQTAARIQAARHMQGRLELGQSLLERRQYEELLFEPPCAQELPKTAAVFRRAAAIRLYTGSKYSGRRETILKNHLLYLRAFLEGHPAGKNVQLIERDGVFYLLCPGNGLLEELFLDLAAHFSQLKTGYVISIGIPAQNNEGLFASRLSALEGLESAFLLGTNRVIDMLHPPSGLQKAALFHWDEEGLLAAVREGRAEGLRLELGQLFAALRSSFTGELAAKAVVTGLTFKLCRIALESGSPAEADFCDAPGLQKQLDAAQTLQELEKGFGDFCTRLCEHLKARQERGYDLALRLRAIAESRCCEELHLKCLAEDLHFSPDYLGKLFKAAFGVSFNEYVHQCRIRLAKRLLAANNETVYHIAQRVGYQNADYFARQFKSLEGVSPNQYRYMLRAGHAADGKGEKTT